MGTHRQASRKAPVPLSQPADAARQAAHEAQTPGATPRPPVHMPPVLLRPGQLLALQRSAGNRSVQRTLRPVIQREEPTPEENQAPTLNEQAVKQPEEFLKTRAGSNWERVRRMYATGQLTYIAEGVGPAGDDGAYEHAAALERKAGMNALLAFRLEETLLKGRPGRSGRKSIMEQVKEEQQLNALGWNYGAGTESPTSDIDSNLSGDGTETAVKHFNLKFRERWGKESGIVFDVNVYARDYLQESGMLGKAHKLLKQQGLKKKLTPKQFEATTFEGSLPQGQTSVPVKEQVRFETSFASTLGSQYQAAMQSEELYALVKVRMDMRNSDWQRFKQAQIKNQPAMREVFAEVERIYAQREEAIRKKIEPELKEGETAQGLKGDPERLHQLRMKAENLLYAEKLEQVAGLRKALKKLRESGASAGQLERAYVLLMNTLHETSIFANEAYVTGAAVRHVVGNKQILSNKAKDPTRKQPHKAGLKIDLTIDEYLHSFHEQIGFIFKELDLYAAEGVPAALKKASKYLYRLGNAAKHIYDQAGASADRDLENIRGLGKYALAIKLGTVEGATNAPREQRGQLDQQALRRGRKQYARVKNLDTLKQQLIDFSTKVQRIFQRHKRNLFSNLLFSRDKQAKATTDLARLS